MGVFRDYGPTDRMDFKVVKEDLCKINMEWNVPWCIGSDFNAVRCLGERMEASNFTHHMHSFDDFIEEMCLVDLPLRGGSCTWSNYRPSNRLDCFLFTANWL